MLEDLSVRFRRRQTAQIWMAALILLLLAATLIICAIAVAKANSLSGRLNAAFSLLLGSQAQAEAAQAASSRCSFAALPSMTLLAVGDPFLANVSWHRPAVLALDGSAPLASLLDQAASQVQDQAAAGLPFLIAISYGYEKLLSRQEGVDDLYLEATAALGAHPELLASEHSLVLLFRRPLPPTRFVPADRQDCSGVPGGSVFNAPSSVEQSMVLAEGASRLAVEALQQALLAYPPAVHVAAPLGLAADRRCLYLSPEQEALLDAYLAPCLSPAAAR